MTYGNPVYIMSGTFVVGFLLLVVMTVVTNSSSEEIPNTVSVERSIKDVGGIECVEAWQSTSRPDGTLVQRELLYADCLWIPGQNRRGYSE